MSLYFILMVGTLAGPVLLSFDKKVHFYMYWKPLFSATLIVATVYLIWDELYTQSGVWGFNPEYLQGWYLGNLPIEEICFFIFVPYACIFVYECLKAYFPYLKFKKLAGVFAFSMSILCLVLSIIYLEKLYTSVACIVALALTIWLYYGRKVKWFADFALTFLVIQIPFFFVNGALTGMFTPEPIVWYNEAEIMGPRWVSIPVEDTIYNYGFLLLVFFFYKKFKKGVKTI